MSFHSEQIRVARKAHKCDGCGGGIAPGEKYTACSGMFEGYFYAAKHCPCCRTGYDAYAAYVNDTSRKGWRPTGSDDWLPWDGFASEVRDWLDYFFTAEIDADKNLTALVASSTALVAWMEKRRQRDLENQSEGTAS